MLMNLLFNILILLVLFFSCIFLISISKHKEMNLSASSMYECGYNNLIYSRFFFSMYFLNYLFMFLILDFEILVVSLSPLIFKEMIFKN